MVPVSSSRKAARSRAAWSFELKIAYVPSSRRGWLTGVCSSALVLALPLHAAQMAKRPRLRLAGPMATVSFPLMRLVDSGALAGLAEQVEFVAWTNPDQLRALVLGGEVDFVAAPSNVAANLYNRGAPLRLLDGVTQRTVEDTGSVQGAGNCHAISRRHAGHPVSAAGTPTGPGSWA